MSESGNKKENDTAIANGCGLGGCAIGILIGIWPLISACLRGSKLWVIPVLGDKHLGEPIAFFTGKFGRIRKATVAPDGSLWLITSNKDGRWGWSKGGEANKDDRVIRVQLKKVYY